MPLFRAPSQASTQVLREICNAGLRPHNPSGVTSLALELNAAGAMAGAR
jgi:hypothetical protein